MDEILETDTVKSQLTIIVTPIHLYKQKQIRVRSQKYPLQTD